MATKTFNWSTCDALECASAVPTTAYLCVPSALLATPVSTTHGFIEAQVTQAVCNNCTGQWTYTLTYDDAQIASGYVLSKANIKEVLCSNCYTDFVLNHLIEAPCSILESCIGVSFVSSDAEFSAALTDSNETICVTAPFTMAASYVVEKSLHILAGGVIETDGNVLTIEGSVTAGAYQVFDTSASELLLEENSTPHVLLEWFGAVGDGVTDDTAAIQLALNASVLAAWIPVTPLNNKVYAITLVTIPFRCTILSPGGRTSGAEIVGLAAGDMFQFPNDSGNERQITIKGGFVINGNGVATTGINAGNVSGTVIDGVSFRELTKGIDQSAGGTINKYYNCRFSTTVDVCIQIGGVSNQIEIVGGMFAADGTNAILTDATWVGGSVQIDRNVFDPGASVVDTISILRLDNASPTMHVNILNNRFDGATNNSHINIGQFNYVNIKNNGFSGVSGSGVFIDGDECTLSDNYFGNVGIEFGANSRYCICNPQKWAGFAPHFIDNGTLNIINPYDAGVVLRKGTTAQRPTLLATGMTGYQYMDTTIDADGKLIWWNNTAWVDATGAVV